MIKQNVTLRRAGLPGSMRMPLLSGADPEHKRQEILDYFLQTYALYERLFDCLADERAWVTSAIALRHPLIFYYGHTAVFFINKLLAARLIDNRLDPGLEAMMAVGVDEMRWDDLARAPGTWPSIPALTAYRSRVRDCVTAFIETMPIRLPIDWQSPAWPILMGIEHERIHLETSSVLIRQLPLEWVRARPDWPSCRDARRSIDTVPVNQMVPVAAGRVSLGKRDSTYGWDNEYGSLNLDLAAFQASQMLVSNAEYYAFVQAGGYRDARWWDQEGWAWRTFMDAVMPTFWVGEPAQHETLELRLMTEQVPMCWDWPVEVNHLEATAFCRWKASQSGASIQLPSEAEWCLLRAQVPGDQPGWEVAPGNLDLCHWASSCPVDRFSHGPCFDVIGNVWQWTSTPIDGFEGFNVHPLYDDFSTPTFDGKHLLIKGGSWISTGNAALRSARYAFRRHFFQHAGFRYVISEAQARIMANPYETDVLVAQYLDFQYGPEYFGVANYARQLAEIAAQVCPRRQCALDIGCATGRATFELSRYFQQVDGIDYSARFIDAALRLAANGHLQYALQQEGELMEHGHVKLADHGIGREHFERVAFSQGDACNLQSQPARYDLVLAANLIDRLREPARFLQDIAPMLKAGGILLLSSPYTWLEEYTPKAHWLGGVRENGEALFTYQALQRLLASDFEEVGAPRDVPFVIRETARKYQHTLAQLTVWRKRGAAEA